MFKSQRPPLVDTRRWRTLGPLTVFLMVVGVIMLALDRMFFAGECLLLATVLALFTGCSLTLAVERNEMQAPSWFTLSKPGSAQGETDDG